MATKAVHPSFSLPLLSLARAQAITQEKGIRCSAYTEQQRKVQDHWRFLQISTCCEEVDVYQLLLTRLAIFRARLFPKVLKVRLSTAS